MWRDRDSTIRRTGSDELELERILQSKSIQSLHKLHTILMTDSKDEPLELSDFFLFRQRTTSINKNDEIITELVIKILEDKEKQSCFITQAKYGSKVTAVPNNISSHYQDANTNCTESTQQGQSSADDEEYDPDKDPALDSIRISSSQGHQDNAIKKVKLNKDALEWFEGIGQLKSGTDTPLTTITEDDENTMTNTPPVNMNNHNAFDSNITSAYLKPSLLMRSVPVQRLSPIPNKPIIPTMNQALNPTIPWIPLLVTSSVPLGSNISLPSANVIWPPPTYIPPQPQFQSVLTSHTISPPATTNVMFQSQAPASSYMAAHCHIQSQPQPHYHIQSVLTPNAQFQHVSTSQQCSNSVSPVSHSNSVNPVHSVTSVQGATQNNHPLMNPVNLNNDNNENNENNENNTHLKPTSMVHAPRQWTPVQPLKFRAKFNNHAKGNFYISKDMIKRMANGAAQQFNTDHLNDEKLAFGYFKESVAMSINDKQIDNIFQTPDGKLVIVINIDLTFKGNQMNMYLIAMENDLEYRKKVRWCIHNFMSAAQIWNNFGISNDYLPQSSRNMKWFIDGMRMIPRNLSRFEIQRILRNVRFRTLPAKTSKRNDEQNNYHFAPKSEITERDLAYYAEESLLNDTLPIVPVVVIKGKHQWIEWKRIICIFDGSGCRQYIAISLRFHQANKQWKIECMDYDPGRVYYQHRLASLPSNNEYNYSFQQISDYITTTLNICQYYANYQR